MYFSTHLVICFEICIKNGYFNSHKDNKEVKSKVVFSYFDSYLYIIRANMRNICKLKVVFQKFYAQ